MLLLLAADFAQGQPPPELARDNIAADAAMLTQAAHRLTGTPQYHNAAEYVRERLAEIGVDQVIIQDFPTAQTKTNVCEITLADGRTLALLPMRPNRIFPPVTPEAGLTGEIIYVGQGGITDFGETSPQDKIVLLDYGSGDGWLRAFRLGARAVIICRGNAMPDAGQSFHSTAPVNIPRFYYNGSPRDFAAAASGTIRSQVVWQAAGGRNIIAHVRGRDPVYFLRQPEVMLVAANLDTFGEVPELAPGARGAANVAGLLHIAQELVQNRPRRHVVLLFLDNQARGHQGASAFYRALAWNVKPVRQEDRQRSLENESRFVREMRQTLGNPGSLGGKSAIEKELLRRVRAKADTATAEIAYEQTQRRLRQKQVAETAAPLAAKLQQENAALQATKDGWNSLQRALSEGDPPTGEAGARLAEALRAVAAEVEAQAGEVELQRRNLAADSEILALMQEWFLLFHTSLALGDSSPRWGVVLGGDSMFANERDSPGLYGRLQGGLYATYEKLAEQERAPQGLDVATINGALADTRAYWAAPGLTHSGEIAGGEGIYNLVLATAQERLGREGTPEDRLANLNLRNMRRQFQEIAAFLQAAGSEESLSQLSTVAAYRKHIQPKVDDSYRTEGHVVLGKTRGKSMADERMPGAMIFAETYRPSTQATFSTYAPKPLYAFDDFVLTRTGVQGAFGYGPVPGDADRRYRAFAATFDAQGNVTYATDRASYEAAGERITVLPVRHGFTVLPPQFLPEAALLYNGRGNSRIDRRRHFLETRDGLATWFTEDRLATVKLFNPGATVALNIASSVNEEILAELGQGFPADNTLERIPAGIQAGNDLVKVSGARLALLRSRGIANASMEELQGEVQDLVESSAAAPTVAAREAQTTSAYLQNRLVYTRSLASIRDLVSAVLVLLLLAVPFSFALERLIIGSTNIYRQIGWFCGFFSVSFLALYFTHPAFAISATPMVIFLGFSVLLLSTLVIWIIMRKFEVELKEMQGLASKLHTADVSRFSTIMAAMNMGISTMRRRPLRTTLTATTILLLTFTILCFASFDQQLGAIRVFSQPAVSYSGVYFHRLNWRAMDPQFLDLLQGRWGGEAAIARRYWLTPERSGPTAPLQNGGFLVTSLEGERIAPTRGMLGLEYAELPHRPEIRRLLGEPAEEEFARTVWFTGAMAQRLRVGPGETVLMGGREFTVGPLLDARRLISTLDMDGSSLLPVDLGAQSQVGVQDTGGGMDEGGLNVAAAGSWTYLPVDSVVVAPAQVCQAMNGTLRAVSLYSRDSVQAGAIADEMAAMTQQPVSATGRDGVYTHGFGSVLKASGAKDLVFPLILGGLVIFGTMLGSVADREREIYTFSALGLAPTHVASLFFAEALVFSVVGGMGGYLLAQLFMRVLEFLAGFGLVTVPEMNYSSSNAIFTILLVMGVVLVSAIFPALKASRSANPGVMRTWKLPRPEGDVMEVQFPFTVSQYDFTGVVSFLKEHFDNFQDASLGVFMAQGTRLQTGGTAADEPADAAPQTAVTLGLESTIALAPFDLGVTQAFRMTSAPSEVEGIDEVHIHLRRTSGQPKDWQRLNTHLLNDLRKQFLIWRALPRETVELYRERTLKRLGRGR